MTYKFLAAIVVSASVLATPAVFAQEPGVAPAPDPVATSQLASSPTSSVVTPASATPAELAAVAPATPIEPPAAEPAAAVPAIAAATANTVAAAAAAAAALDDAAAYQIGPEDVLDISVWKNPELSRTVPVRPDGKVSLPLVNDIKAAGLTPTALREQVTARLAEYIPSPEVSVMVREVHSRKVAVVGAVKTPGRFELKSPMTVLEVIALAQGFTDFATRDKIVVLREENGVSRRIPFNYSKIADNASQTNFRVLPGDIIVVP